MSNNQKLTNDAFIPKNSRQLLWLMVKPYKKRTALFFVLTFIGVLGWAAAPVIVAEIIDKLSQTKTLDSNIWKLAFLYGAFLMLDELSWRSAEFLMRSFKPQMVESVRTNLFAETLKKPYSFFVNASSGRIGHWINQSTSTANEVIDNTIWTVWGQVVGLVLSTVFLFTVHWSLALLFLVWLVTLFSYNAYRGKTFGKLVAQQSDETSKASSIVVDSMSNHLSVRVFNAQFREIKRLQQQQTHIVSRWRASWWQNWITNSVKGQSSVVVSVFALLMVLALYGKGIVPIGGIVLFIAYFGSASNSLWQLAWALDSYFRSFGTIQNALDGLSGQNERQIETIENTKYTIPNSVELSINGLSFSYPEQPDTAVLDKLNIQINAGEKIGVVGHSGAGKSTLIGLLLGFYEPTSGNISVNGGDLSQKDPLYIRSISAFVPQDTSLFNRSIKENVMYARPKATVAEFEDALKQAQAYKFVQKLPNGADTIVGERGVKLSGGQRQRLAIARAILQNSPLLLLDEATSALDSVSEQAIQKALHGLMQNRTTIVIAHRLSTLRHLDKIVVLSEGKIAEQGSHDELVSKNGIYADLWHRQKDGFIVD